MDKRRSVEVRGLNGAFNEAHIKSVSGNMLAVVYENRHVRLQAPENCREEAERKDQPGQAGVGDTGRQPAGGAGVGQERIHVTESRSRSLNSLSNEGHSSQPSDSGEHAEANGACTEESWLSEGGRQDWVLKFEAKPPKVSKSTRRRRNRHKSRLQYTLEDEYDAEEMRLTPIDMMKSDIFPL